MVVIDVVVPLLPRALWRASSRNFAAEFRPRRQAFRARRSAMATVSVMASVRVAAIDRKPSKLASEISIHSPAIWARGENGLSVMATMGTPRPTAARVRLTVSDA